MLLGFIDFRVDIRVVRKGQIRRKNGVRDMGKRHRRKDLDGRRQRGGVGRGPEVLLMTAMRRGRCERP